MVRARTIAISAACWFLWGTLYATRLRAVKPESSWGQILHYSFSDAVVWMLLTPFVLAVASRFPVASPVVMPRLALHLLLGSLFALVHVFLDALQHSWFALGDSVSTVPQFLSFALPGRIHPNLMIYGVLVGIGHVLDHRRDLGESRRKMAELRADLAEARLRALRLQLHPHFLFNCLNTITGLVDDRPDDARRMIQQLSQLLRSTLRTREEEIPLRDELALVSTYLDIERIRFGERLGVEWDVEPACLEMLVPSFLLQPVVENAVRHGVGPRPEGGAVALRARRDRDRLEIEIEDDGVGLQPAANEGGVGLGTLRERLRERYGSQHGVRVVERQGGGTTVSLWFQPLLPAVSGAAS